MDHRRNRNQRCGYHGDVPEPEYAVVDDQEEALNVCILPARPIFEETEYADRDPLRSASAQSPSSTGNSSLLTRCPPRKVPLEMGPAVNRDLKPGRRKNTSGKSFTPPPPGNQHPLRSSPSLPPSSLQLGTPRPGWTELYRRDRHQKATKKQGVSRPKDLQSPETVSGSSNGPRRCLDLESHEIDRRSRQDLERRPSGRPHHEWPQTKDDFDQHGFVAKEKPQQTYCKGDWYIGACPRADAEHALHLVNKDGAFLVRNCSMNIDGEPLVLSVYHERKVYNVKIRFIESTSKFVLGTGHRSNDMFDSVADIIEFHTIFPIILISGRNTAGSKYPENCVLKYSVSRSDVDQLLR